MYSGSMNGSLTALHRKARVRNNKTVEMGCNKRPPRPDFRTRNDLNVIGVERGAENEAADAAKACTGGSRDDLRPQVAVVRQTTTRAASGCGPPPFRACWRVQTRSIAVACPPAASVGRDFQ